VPGSNSFSILPPVRTLLRGAERLQNGRLDAYITYMLPAVLARLAVILSVT
jgi:hydrogenase-4 component B